MKSSKFLTIKTLFSALAVFTMIFGFAGVSFAKFYCPLGYSYNPKVQLCVGKGSLKGYNALPATKVNKFKGKTHLYICPDKYVYSKKIQLCTGEGSLKGATAQPTVKPLEYVKTLNKKVKKVKKSTKKS